MIGAYSVVNTPENFHGEKIQYFLENWKKITSDPWTRQQMKGYKLEFSGVQQQAKMPRNYCIKRIKDLILGGLYIKVTWQS